MNNAIIKKIPRTPPTQRGADRDTIPSGEHPLPFIPTKPKVVPGSKPRKPGNPYKPSKKYLSQQNTI